MKPRFAGRVALITGAAGALGCATSIALAREGALLTLFDKDADSLARVAQDCPDALVVVGNTCLSADLARAVETTRARRGPIELLVAAAGILGPAKPLIEVEEDEWDLLFDVNVKGAWLAAKAAIPQMREAGKGSVVLFSSTAGLAGSPTLPAYSASKGAVALLTRSLALNHAQEGIRVNCVCPGTIDSPMAYGSFAQAGDTQAQQERRQFMMSRHPMNRFGTPDEVASAVLYLLSDDAGFTTGVALPVDGGRLA